MNLGKYRDDATPDNDITYGFVSLWKAPNYTPWCAIPATVLMAPQYTDWEWNDLVAENSLLCQSHHHRHQGQISKLDESGERN